MSKRLKVGQTVYVPVLRFDYTVEPWAVRITSNKYPLPREGEVSDYFPLKYIESCLEGHKYFTSRRKCLSYCKIVMLTGKWY